MDDKRAKEKSDEHQLVQLMVLFSPFFPIGSFSYSHGLEQAVHDGLISCRGDAELWIRGLLQKGTILNDTIFLSHAWQEEKRGESNDDLIQLAFSFAGSMEREKETRGQGEAFLVAASDYGFDCHSAFRNGIPPYSIATGCIAARMEIELVAIASAFVQSFVFNLIQILLRLMPLGQRDSIKLMQLLEEDIVLLSRKTPHLTLNDLGSAAFTSDICFLRHETLYPRLFCS